MVRTSVQQCLVSFAYHTKYVEILFLFLILFLSKKFIRNSFPTSLRLTASLQLSIHQTLWFQHLLWPLLSFLPFCSDVDWLRHSSLAWLLPWCFCGNFHLLVDKWKIGSVSTVSVYRLFSFDKPFRWFSLEARPCILNSGSSLNFLWGQLQIAPSRSACNSLSPFFERCPCKSSIQAICRPSVPIACPNDLIGLNR